MITIRTTLAVSGMLVLLQACGGGGGGSDSGGDREDAINTALRQSVENAILPAAAGFSDRAASLSSSVDNFCTEVSADNLAAAQSSWKSLIEQWYRLALYNFGPLNDDIIFPAINFIDSFRERGTNYTATVRDEIDTHINGSDTLGDTYFDNLTFNKTGLLPLELLIFETAHSDHSQQSADIVTEYENTPRKCEYLTGMSAQILKHAEYVNEGWVTQFKDSEQPYETIFLSGELEDGSEPVATLLVSVQGHLDYLHKRSVANNAAQVSGHTWPSLAASLDEVETLLAGTEDTTISFFSLMQSAGLQSYVDDVNNNIAATRSAINTQDVNAFETAVAALDGNFKREILNGLNVDPGINFTDGD